MKMQREKEKAEIPTASMADIAFLLIVFFMLTTVFSANRGMEHVLPPKDDQDQDVIEPEEAIYIKIFVSGQFEMDKQAFSIEQADRVYQYVYSKVQVNAKKPIILHTNPEAEYGDMVKILDQLKQIEIDMEQPLAITLPSKAEAARYDRMN